MSASRRTQPLPLRLSSHSYLVIFTCPPSSGLPPQISRDHTQNTAGAGISVSEARSFTRSPASGRPNPALPAHTFQVHGEDLGMMLLTVPPPLPPPLSPLSLFSPSPSRPPTPLPLPLHSFLLSPPFLPLSLFPCLYVGLFLPFITTPPHDFLSSPTALLPVLFR